MGAKKFLPAVWVSLCRFSSLRFLLLASGSLLCLRAASSLNSQRLLAAPPEPKPAAQDAKDAKDAKPPAADPTNGKAVAAQPADAGAKPAIHPVGHLIRIPVPIEGNVDTAVRSAVGRVLGKAKPGGPRPILVLEFVAGQADGGRGSEFGRAMELAKFISSSPELNGVKTVAYVPHTVKGHAVLAIMACEEIIMAPDAEIGDAGIDETNIGPTIRSGYKEIAEARKTIPTAIALGMLDKDLRVLKVVTELGTEFVLASDLDELKKHRAVQKVEELTPTPGLYTGRKARQELGFVSYLADDPRAVARALDLSADAMRDDPSLYGGWRPVQVPLKGIITRALADETQRKIREQIDNRSVNFICLWIDSAGGSAADSDSLVNLANYLASLDPAKVRTVAYIPSKARGDAAILAIACDQIVMGPAALIGGSGDYEFQPVVTEMLSRKIIRDNVAKTKKISWSLPAALLDSNVKVFRYVNQTTGQKNYFSDDEAKSLPDADQWQQGEQVWGGGELRPLPGERAEELGLAAHTASNFTEFKQWYGLDHDLALVEPGWADFLIGALSSPGMLGLLLFLGVAGVIAELHSPGMGVGAFVALVAFMLYFWIEHLHGTAGWLEVLLFVAGLGCLLLEIFVLPGFAIFGLGGGLMIIASLVLASQTFLVPQNDYQWEQLQTTLASIGGAVLGAVALMLVTRRFLPHTPGLNRMLLEPPSGLEREHIAAREALVDFSDLVGQVGTTTTLLVPSGKARFGDVLVDVTADGEMIDRGTQVVVVEARGNRVVVHRAEA
jgi:membrane-bound ClpP family serine protease